MEEKGFKEVQEEGKGTGPEGMYLSVGRCDNMLQTGEVAYRQQRCIAEIRECLRAGYQHGQVSHCVLTQQKGLVVSLECLP